MEKQDQRMQALVFDRVGEAGEVLALCEVAVPRPAAGQVLVALDSSPIHPADFFFVRGTYRVKPVFPQIAGLSGVGRVVALGEGVTLPLGSRVTFRAPGAWAEFAAVPVERTFLVPDDIASDQATQFTLNPITAYGLLEAARVRPGEWIALTAAASSVAAQVSALAHARGVRVVGIARAESLAALADSVIGVADSAPDLGQALRDATGGAGVSALIDCVGGPLLSTLLLTVRQGGTIIAYGTLDPEPVSVTNATLVYGNLTWQGFGIDRFVGSLTPEQVEQMASALWQAIRARSLPLPVQASFALDDFSAALARTSAGGPGKVLLRPRDPQG